ncbi:hypothetical protein GCM10022222_04990 [Amycolatopsis ultiminotia]|uniref:Major facilitator superfamily (MFS) profile domain-containing protein n=1 Tax=Amycolatopsis ultiminotia TaxID=543629 RepID=A0ABP6UY54_9PSEU
MTPGSSLRAVFAGRRGRLLAALLFAEFGGAVQSIAYSSVLPIASNELAGAGLYGATLAAGSFTTILVLAAGPGPFARMAPGRVLAFATLLYVVGAALCVTAPAMGFVLAGTIVRGLSGGLLAGFGMTALGALYQGSARTRVMGLFALMWLLPALAGPAVNAMVTIAAGWRAAMAWPAVLVVLGRLLIGRDAQLIPWKRSRGTRLGPGNAVVLLGGLAVATAAPAAHERITGTALLVLGVLGAGWAALRTLRSQVDGQRTQYLVTATMFWLCLAFFGGSGTVPLAAVNGLGRGVVASSVVVGAGLVAWALTGLRRSGGGTVPGLLFVAVGLVLEVLAQVPAIGRVPALLILVAAWALAGLGMGLSYAPVSSSVFDGVDTGRTAQVATAIAFAETAGTAVGALVSGGVFSTATSLGVGARGSVIWSFALLAMVAVAALCTHVRVRGGDFGDRTG